MATATDNEIAQTAEYGTNDFAALPKATVDFINNLQKENEELKKENAELTKFVNYVRGLKTHEDFNKLRNVINAVNKKFK